KVIASLDGKLDTINAAALQADGKVIVVGASGQQMHLWQIVHEFLIARFNPDGSLDHGFGSNGWGTFNFAAVDSHANGVAVESNGNIVVVGQAQLDAPSLQQDFAVACFRADGSLDASFGTGGEVLTRMSVVPNDANYDTARGVALTQGGKLLVYGNAVYPDDAFAIARYNPDGSLDTTFGHGGKVLTDVGEYGADLNGLVVQSDGKIVVTGNFPIRAIPLVMVYGGPTPTIPPPPHSIVVRLNADGGLDTTFGNAGRIEYLFGYADYVGGV